jgi:hypothetical protein
VRKIFKEHSVFLAPGLVFTAVQNQIARISWGFPRELPFFSGGKASSAAAAKPGVADDLDDILWRHSNGSGESFIAATSTVFLKSLMSLWDAMREKDAFHASENPRVEELVDEFFQGRVDGI